MSDLIGRITDITDRWTFRDVQLQDFKRDVIRHINSTRRILSEIDLESLTGGSATTLHNHQVGTLVDFGCVDLDTGGSLQPRSEIYLGYSFHLDSNDDMMPQDGGYYGRYTELDSNDDIQPI